MVQLYGIPTCGSVRKARAWFKARNTEVVFHNFREEGLSADELDLWLAQVDADRLLNRRGQLWRKVPQETRDDVKDNDQKIRQLLLEMPGLIKRPVIVFTNGTVTVGVDEALWENILTQSGQ